MTTLKAFDRSQWHMFEDQPFFLIDGVPFANPRSSLAAVKEGASEKLKNKEEISNFFDVWLCLSMLTAPVNRENHNRAFFSHFHLHLKKYSSQHTAGCDFAKRKGTELGTRRDRAARFLCGHHARPAPRIDGYGKGQAIFGCCATHMYALCNLHLMSKLSSIEPR